MKDNEQKGKALVREESAGPAEAPRRPGFFGRILSRIDDSLKAKAERSGGCCCSGESGKEGEDKSKCC